MYFCYYYFFLCIFTHTHTLTHFCLVFHIPFARFKFQNKKEQKQMSILKIENSLEFILTHGINSAEVINNFGIRKGSQNTPSIYSLSLSLSQIGQGSEDFLRFYTFIKVEKRFEHTEYAVQILYVRSNGSVTKHAGILSIPVNCNIN